MKKSVIWLVVVAMLISSVALACNADNPECPSTAALVWGLITNRAERHPCSEHANCVRTDHYGQYGYMCPVCSYGREETAETLISSSHSLLNR